MDAARPFGSSAKTRPIPRAARSRMFRRWRARCSAKKSATLFGPDNPMRRSSRLSEPKSFEQGWLAMRITRSSLQTDGTSPICPTFEILPALHLPRRAFPKNTPNPDIGSHEWLCGPDAFVRFQGGQYGNRYCEVFQLPKGLRLHSTGEWRPRRVRSRLGRGARRHARSGRGSEAQLRDRSGPAERQVG